MIFEAKEIVVHYGEVQVLRRVSLEMSPGKIITLIGSNGAGKTTILKAISGLLKLTSGAIFFANHRIDRIRPHKVVELGIAHVPEGRGIFPDLTVYENLIIGAFTRKNKEIRSDLDERFETFPFFKERKHMKAGLLSGGEQQMLAIARALMARPKLMLLDEPTLGLAPLIVNRVTDIIKEINRDRVSVILVEQNARIALAMADRGYVLETGRVVLHGEGNDLIHNDHVRKVYLGG